MNPLRSAERRYLPGAIPVMANWPAASVEPVLLTWMLVTPGDISTRRRETRARRTGSPVAALETWPLTEQESPGLVWAASASGNRRSAPSNACFKGGTLSGPIIARRSCRDSRNRSRCRPEWMCHPRSVSRRKGWQASSGSPAIPASPAVLRWIPRDASEAFGVHCDRANEHAA